MPFEARGAARHLGATYDPARRKWVHVGTVLPDVLRGFLPAPWSWEDWQTVDANGGFVRDLPPDDQIVLRPHQQVAANLIVQAHAAGRAGFLVADELGLGKTFTAIKAVHALPATVRNVLVVAPLSVLAGWRKSLRATGTGGRRWCLINPDRLRNLLAVPASAANAKTAKTRNRRHAMSGAPLVKWNAVVVDESHLFRNPVAQRTYAMRSVTAEAFTIWMSATAGQTPLELSYLAPVLGAVTGTPVRDLEAFEQWCASVGISVTQGAYGRWEWTPNPDELALMRSILFGQHNNNVLPLGIRRLPGDIAGWPEQQRILLPVDLDADQRRQYDEAWTAFRREWGLAQRGHDPARGLAAQTRFRQKASLVRTPGTVDHVLTLLDSGRQVFVSCQWLESLDAIVDALTAKKVPVVAVHGQMGEAEREANRQAFQTGQATVIVSTVTAGINLQQGEAGGNDVARATVLHDCRWSAIDTHQTTGRCHRDGQNAVAYFAYATDTIEERIVTRAVERMADMGDMHGDDTDAVRELEAVLHGAVDSDPDI